MITCRGTGEPTILLEHGLDYDSWGNIWEAIPFWEISRTCYYPRVGMYLEAASGPRTTLDQVKDLHSILEQTGIPGPYILVGHSIADLNLLVYTDQYPEEVVGLVCVDCRHLSVDEIFVEKIKAELAVNPNRKFEYLGDPIADGAVWGDREKLDYLNSAKQVRQVTSLGNRPVVVLVASYDNRVPDSDPDKEKEWQLWLEAWNMAANQLSKLSTQGRMEVVPNVDHISILTNGAVTRAIQEVYDKVTRP